MWADYGVEFFIHPRMMADAATAFPDFFGITGRANRAG